MINDPITLNHPDFQILKRVKTSFEERDSAEEKQFMAAIIDLETLGLDARQHDIIELGLLAFSFSSEGILSIVDSYNELNDPGKPIPQEITAVTGIRDEDVRGKHIDWAYIGQLLHKTHLIICHNSRFDRNFLELQTPHTIQPLIRHAPFACTMNDINWKNRGFESVKLDYLNWKLGFFYDGHRALNDCWATFNLLIQADGAFEELKENLRKKETLLSATNAPFDKKDLLKERQYRWSDGLSQLPKGWWRFIPNEELVAEHQWLDELIYGKQGASLTLPRNEITARKRYSFRAEVID